jgi:hypothetical protein
LTNLGDTYRIVSNRHELAFRVLNWREKEQYARRDLNPQPSVPKAGDTFTQSTYLSNVYDDDKRARCFQWCHTKWHQALRNVTRCLESSSITVSAAFLYQQSLTQIPPSSNWLNAVWYRNKPYLNPLVKCSRNPA